MVSVAADDRTHEVRLIPVVILGFVLASLRAIALGLTSTLSIPISSVC